MRRLARVAYALADLALVSAVGTEGAPAVRGALGHLALHTRRFGTATTWGAFHPPPRREPPGEAAAPITSAARGRNPVPAYP